MNHCSTLFNFLVFPYRDKYFLDSYGCIVRDLHIIESLRRHPRVGSLTVVNRPAHFVERLIKRKRPLSLEGRHAGGMRYWDATSFSVTAPLAWDEWKRQCYAPCLDGILELADFSRDTTNVVLDFNPIALIDYDVLPNCIKWYDLIDNFAKHNRFNYWQREKVKEKYRYVAQKADLVTGVSDAALRGFGEINKVTLHNKLLDRANPKAAIPQYEFGFTGFITNKFDVDFVRSLVHGGKMRIAVYGEILDSTIEVALRSIEGIDLFGKFVQSEMTEILSTFAIGLIPYRPELSHDESPIKLYAYLDSGRPVLSLQDYEVNNPYVHVVDSAKPIIMKEFINQSLSQMRCNPHETVESIRATLNESHTWHGAINDIMENCLNPISRARTY